MALTLDAFPKTHRSKDVKLSFDSKELARPAVGFGTVGDEDMIWSMKKVFDQMERSRD